jgi:hypothetical protein
MSAVAIELLPCPFCGGTPQITQDREIFFVRCLKCHGQQGGYGFGWKKPEAAAEWWNQRFLKAPEVLPDKTAAPSA